MTLTKSEPRLRQGSPGLRPFARAGLSLVLIGGVFGQCRHLIRLGSPSNLSELFLSLLFFDGGG